MNMKLRFAIPTLLLAWLAHAEEAARPLTVDPAHRVPMSPPGFPGAPESWLGVDLSKPDHTLVTHLPSLPAGVGFVVKTVHEDGPAAIAGLQETDLLWKLDDQLLINEAQLSTLLRIHQPGASITLTIFRSGGQIEVPLTLGQNPGPPSGIARNTAEEALLLNEPGPMRVVNMTNREAYIANTEGRAVVRKVDDGYWLTIENAEGEIIHDASFDRGTDKCERDGSIPREWKRRAYALRRGLDHALDGGIVSQRLPRPRVVPPPSTVKP